MQVHRIALTGLTMAEYFRDEKKSLYVLMFVDNIFRFAATNQVLRMSALLGRIPSAVGYQPTLRNGKLQERITFYKIKVQLLVSNGLRSSG